MPGGAVRKIRVNPKLASCSQLQNTYTAPQNAKTTENIFTKTKYSGVCEKCGLGTMLKTHAQTKSAIDCHE
jgi:ribosomal protein L33